MKVSASLTCCDLSHLSLELHRLEKAGIDAYHYDVSDGQFSPYFNLGDELFPYVKKESKLPIMIHLAVENSLPYVIRFLKLKADIIAIHYESKDFIESFEMIKESNAKVYVAFKSDTIFEKEHLQWILQSDGILKLLVNPGKAGQKMQEKALEDIRAIRNCLTYYHKELPIEADGNINPSTITKVMASGADRVTGGSSGLFVNHEYAKNIEILRGGK